MYDVILKCIRLYVTKLIHSVITDKDWKLEMYLYRKLYKLKQRNTRPILLFCTKNYLPYINKNKLLMFKLCEVHHVIKRSTGSHTVYIKCRHNNCRYIRCVEIWRKERST